MLAFYKAIGADLESKQIKSGGISYQGQLGKLNLALYGIPKGGKSSSPNFSMKIEVDNLKDVMARLESVKNIEILMDQESLPDGKLSVVVDPEGHSIEIIEPWKQLQD